MKRILCALFLCVLLLGQPGSVTASSPTDPQPAGVIVVSAQSGPFVTTTGNSWYEIPSMKTRITMPLSGDLIVTFCAEAFNSLGFTWLRITDNGATMSPSDVVFSAGTNLESHCFTFVKQNAPAGFHVLRAEWNAGSGNTGYLGDRTMTITFSSPVAEDLRLLAVAAPSGATLDLSNAWTDISGLGGTINLPANSDLAITISAETYTDGGNRLFVRGRLDDLVASASDSILAVSGLTGTRAYTYILKNVPAGAHTVHLESLCDTANACHIADRTLTVIAATLGSGRRVVGSFVAAPSGAAIDTTNTGWENIPDSASSFFSPAEIDLAIQFTAEIYESADVRIFIRALIDGQPANPSDVVILTGGWTGTHAFTFVAHNLGRGNHTLQMQWKVDSDTGSIGDHTTAAWGYAAQHPVMVVAMESNRGQPGYAYGGLFSSSVVDDAGGVRTFKPFVRERLFGAAPSVAGYFLENSFGNYYMVDGGLRGPYLKQYDEWYYRHSVPDPFTTMQLEALQKLDQDNFDFSLYDRDGNGTITRKELVTLVALYQDTVDGFVRTIPNYTTNDGVVLDNSVFPHVYLPDFQTNEEIGLIAHELAHVLINAGDMYETTWDPTAPGPFSLMDQHQNHPDLDPWHKLNAHSFFDAIPISQDGYILVPAVESSGVILKLADPGHAGEYFLVENRQKIGYDALLPDQGLAIWHINENTMEVPRNGVMIEPSCGPTNPIQWNQLLYDGSGLLWGKDFWWGSTGSNSRWVNGSDSKIGVWAISSSQNPMLVFVDVPGPGILVDIQPEMVITGAGSSRTVQVRLVNTGPSPDNFGLSSSLPPAWVQWSQNPVTLGSYEEKIVTMQITPPKGTPVGQILFTVSATGASTPHPSTTHPQITLAVIINHVFMPSVRK